MVLGSQSHDGGQDQSCRGNGCSGYVSVNGTVSALHQARIPALDRGWLYGDAVIETLAGYGDRLWNYAAHWQRLVTSAQHFHITVPLQEQELHGALRELLGLLKVDKAFVRIVITRGQGFGLLPSQSQSGDGGAHYYLYVTQAPRYSPMLWTQGIKLSLCSITYQALQPHKTGYYLPAIQAWLSLGDEESELLWVRGNEERDGARKAEGEGDDSAHVLECASSHVFFIHKASGGGYGLVTPDLGGGILRGITREEVMTVARGWGIEVMEREVRVAELCRFGECFVCSSVRGLVPVASVYRQRRLFWQSQGQGSGQARSLFSDFHQKYLSYQRHILEGMPKHGSSSGS